MDAMRECCCGLDVHQAQVTACLLKGPLSQKAKKQSQQSLHVSHLIIPINNKVTTLKMYLQSQIQYIIFQS